MARTAGVEIHVAPPDNARVIYLGVPSFGMVSINWHAHVMQLQAPLNRAVFHGYALAMEVGQGRNYLVEQALHWRNDHGHTVSHVFFIDDDVLVPPDALTTLLAHRRPIVSGLYYAKTEALQPLVLLDPHGGVAQDLPASGLVECFAHGMGCTLIEIGVFRALLAAQAVEYETLPSGQRLPQFFKTTRDERSTDAITGAPIVRQETEDVFFLKRAAALGFQPAVDCGVFCWHFDSKTRRSFPLTRPHMAQDPAVTA